MLIRLRTRRSRHSRVQLRGLQGSSILSCSLESSPQRSTTACFRCRIHSFTRFSPAFSRTRIRTRRFLRPRRPFRRNSRTRPRHPPLRRGHRLRRGHGRIAILDAFQTRSSIAFQIPRGTVHTRGRQFQPRYRFVDRRSVSQSLWRQRAMSTVRQHRPTSFTIMLA